MRGAGSVLQVAADELDGSKVVTDNLARNLHAGNGLSDCSDFSSEATLDGPWQWAMLVKGAVWGEGQSPTRMGERAMSGHLARAICVDADVLMVVCLLDDLGTEEGRVGDRPVAVGSETAELCHRDKCRKFAGTVWTIGRVILVQAKACWRGRDRCGLVCYPLTR